MRHIHITPQLVQAVRDAVEIVDVASEHTRLKRAGRRLSGLCPLHKEKTPSFSVDPERGLFYCFGCGQGGDAIRLHMLLSGDDFPAAIEGLARRYGIPLPSRPVRRRQGPEEPDLEPVLDAAEEFFRQALGRAAEPTGYLRKREISPELIERYRLGYAPAAWRELLGALTPRFSVAELEAAGLVGRSQKRAGEPFDRFRNRLMFPIRNAAGRLLGFGGRVLAADDHPKYLNTAETARFRKGYLLYGLEVAKREIRERGKVLLVEGYFDVLGAAAAGLPWVVASMGTALTSDQCRLLARFADEVVVGYDSDPAGQLAARRALPLLLAQGLGVRLPALGEGHDPDSLRMAEGAEALVDRVERAPDAVTSELERLIPRGTAADPRAQARAARSVTELLRPIPDGILRYGYARVAADRLGIPADLLLRRLGGEGGGRRDEAGDQGQPPAREVRSAEERVIHLLLEGGVELPPVERLPPPEAFLDPVCRNIFEAFRALYRDGGPEPPPARAVLSRLGTGGEAVDQVARILLEGPVAAGSEDLEESLGQIQRRWQQQRLRELSAEIGEAQRAGDRPRLQRLLEEKTSLSQLLHRAGDSAPRGKGT